MTVGSTMRMTTWSFCILHMNAAIMFVFNNSPIFIKRYFFKLKSSEPVQHDWNKQYFAQKETKAYTLLEDGVPNWFFRLFLDLANYHLNYTTTYQKPYINMLWGRRFVKTCLPSPGKKEALHSIYSFSTAISSGPSAWHCSKKLKWQKNKQK